MYASSSKRRRIQAGEKDSDVQISEEENSESENYDSESNDSWNSDSSNPLPYVVPRSSDESDDNLSEHKVSGRKKQLKKDLNTVLTRIQEKKTFEFAVGNSSELIPTTPGIKIPGYGTVSLPVTETTVKDLGKHFHQAPYGLGEETLIDKAVRDSLQLDPKNFEITNPKFNAGVKKLVRELQDDLGCSEQNVTSHLYKLLLYEPGGHFKPHRDTEKHEGMFATLIIQLPSVFTGGDLVVKHGSREKRIEFGTPESEFSCVYAAHYADCEHELTEITSGYRMALVYSLCWDGNGVVPSPPDIPTNKLVGLLQQLDQVLPHHSMVAWRLDHHYSEKSFLNKGVQALKGGDKLIYSTLQGANALLEEDKKLDFFIVEAKRVDNMYGTCTLEYEGYGRCWGYGGGSGDCFDNDGDCEKEYKFKVIGVDGKPWKEARGFRLSVRKDVLNVGEDDDKFWGECHEGECSGPSGNEGASKTNWYRRYVLVIFPKKNTVKVVYKNRLQSAIDYLAQQVENEDTASVRKLAIDIVDLCVEQKEKFCSNENSVVTMLKLVIKLKDLDFLRRILPLLSEPLVTYWHSSGYYWRTQQTKGAFGIPSEKVISVLKDLISTFGWQPLSKSLEKVIESCPSKHYKQVAMFLEQCPEDVPKDELLVSLVQKAVNIADPETNLSDESLKAIGLVIFNHPQSCSQYIQPFLDSPKLQSLHKLSDMLSCLIEKKDKRIKENKLYQMTLAKYSEKLNELSKAENFTSTTQIDAVVKGAESLVSMQENNLFEKLVETVLHNPNANLLKKLLAGYLGQAVKVSEPLKRLILARINQLVPIVHAGKPRFSWCQPTAVIPGHPEVQAFLRGPERSFVYNRFNAKCQAKKFEKDHFMGRINARLNIMGCRSSTVVEITKVPANKWKHDEAVRKYAEDCEELKRLQAKVGVKSEKCS